MLKKTKKTKKPNKVAKKVTRRRRKAVHTEIDSTVILDIDQVYKAINKVQLAKEPVTFVVRSTESAVIENILKDLTLKFSKKKAKISNSECAEYSLVPSPDPEPTEDFANIEEFPDEIDEDGQIFF